jgi:uncharacterized protein (DUF433 family)
MTITETIAKRTRQQTIKPSVSETRAKMVSLRRAAYPSSGTAVVRRIKTISKKRHQIVRRPAVMGGDACIGNTRIPVWALVVLWIQGASNAEIQEAYPGLTEDQIEAARQCALRNPNQIAKEIRDHLLLGEDDHAFGQ